jgi:D-serine deaminase-like pyridoxal phosphate-dependent protein
VNAYPKSTGAAMSSLTLIGRHKSELPTPCLLLDVGKLDRNIAKMSTFFADAPASMRPHTKTHKSAFIAHKQIRAGAIGITCGKIEEAKAFAYAGIDDLLIANQIVDPTKIEELIGLSKLVTVITCVDDIANAQLLSEMALKGNVVLDVLLEVDVGFSRCGTLPGEPSLELVRKLLDLKGLNFRGVMGYEGALSQMGFDARKEECRVRHSRLIQTVNLLRDSGIEVEIVSGGGSNNHEISAFFPGMTEVQVGSYCTMDRLNTDEGIPFEEAVTVLTTVISRPTPNRVITDAGKKAISLDKGLPTIEGRPDIVPEPFNEEHGKFVITEGGQYVAVGERLEMTPTHGCTTIPFYRNYVLIKDEIVAGICPILTASAVY